MSRASRRGRKGEGTVTITLSDGRAVTLSAYEVRAAYRALYSVTEKRRRRGDP